MSRSNFDLGHVQTLTVMMKEAEVTPSWMVSLTERRQVALSHAINAYDDIIRLEHGAQPGRPIPMRLTCPACGALHVDEGDFAEKPHHTHACQACGMVWRPAVEPTVGVRFLPGFKDAP